MDQASYFAEKIFRRGDASGYPIFADRAFFNLPESKVLVVLLF